jgi:GR25 family glycosyltransferase involved in LPS biosynthesis
MKALPGGCWDNFDKFYCISVAERKDRRKSVKIQLAKANLDKKVEYVIVQRHPTNREEGIFESHRICLRRGLQAGARRIVIFEDDVVIEGFDPKRLEQCLRFFETYPSWQILFLGCLVSRSRPTEYSAVREIDYRCLSHAYIINRPFAQELIKKPWSGIPLDAELLSLLTHAFALYPFIAFQSNARSDNDRHRGLELIRRLCGGLRMIQKVNEWFHRNYEPYRRH